MARRARVQGPGALGEAGATPAPAQMRRYTVTMGVNRRYNYDATRHELKDGHLSLWAGAELVALFAPGGWQALEVARET